MLYFIRQFYIMKKYTFYTISFALVIFLTACKQDGSTVIETKASTSNLEAQKSTDLPEWAISANIYEVNLRQYTPEGTFKAFESHLPRLKEMGVDILWLMPIYPISKKKRKGTLGSYYAVSDYKGINPEHGNAEDFKQLVESVHKQGMRVILDFVPNHTGWDHPWVKDHPEWYTQNEAGEIIDPIDPGTGESWGWTDVADLNYENEDMRTAMIEDMKFWISEYDVDGFRQDVAHQVPADFWAKACKELKALKPVFMLAESEVPAIVNDGSFHADYGWSFHHLLNDLASSGKTEKDILSWQKKYDDDYNSKGFQILFTSNHDENTWNGTVFDRMKAAHRALAVLTYTLPGMPLVYGGQEEPLKKQLKFFEKDDIGFKDYKYRFLYKNLNMLKKENKALWNGPYGGSLNIIQSEGGIFAFERNLDGNEVIVIINMTNTIKDYEIPKDIMGYQSLMSNNKSSIKKGTIITLPNWDYRVLYKK